jgi:ATP-binding cassette subfamily B protein
MLAINPGLGLIALAPVPFVVVISYRYGRRARPAIQETQQRIAELTADAEENISGVRVVKAFAREDRQLRRFQSAVGRVFSQAMVATRLEARYNPAIAFLPQFGLAAVLLLGGKSVIDAHLTLGQFTEFYLYLNMLIAPMRSLGVTLNLAQRATASGARIFQLLDREPRLSDPPHPRALPAGNGRVQLVGVTMRYEDAHDELGASVVEGAISRRPESGRAVLSDLDLDVPAGRTVALVGATGSGKTSLVALISRLYDPVAGEILLDGADVRELAVRDVRGAVAVVSDDPFLFSETVAENIAYAHPDATREAIEQAARRAQAHEFIEHLPDGYDTRVGERGLTLSGGQRQRLAIARALLADFPVLILDEPGEHLDTQTADAIVAEELAVTEGKTTLLITHRLTGLEEVDEVLVLDHGRVLERGTHGELLTLGGRYAALWRREQE